MGERFLRPAQLRTEPRVIKHFRVNVVGVDTTGTVFNEKTQTENVSPHGVCFILGSHVQPGARIGVTAKDELPGNPLLTFEVRWTSTPLGRHMMVGARLITGHEWLAFLNQADAAPMSNE